MDIQSSIVKQYAHYTNDEVFPIQSYGQFFPQICQNPDKYI